MCLAIALPATVEVPEATLRAGFETNKDGAGFGYYKNAKTPVIHKGYMNFGDFYKEFSAHRKANKQKPFLVHFRIRTHGKVSALNCHPFQLRHGMLVHNGTIHGLGGYGDAGTSDTEEFAELINKVQPNQMPALCEGLKTVITYNAVAILDKTGTIHFAGTKDGSWIDGAWYSNELWKRKPYTGSAFNARDNRVIPAGHRFDHLRDEDDGFGSSAMMGPYGEMMGYD